LSLPFRKGWPAAKRLNPVNHLHQGKRLPFLRVWLGLRLNPLLGSEKEKKDSTHRLNRFWVDESLDGQLSEKAGTERKSLSIRRKSIL
jgi:hypothetical protein